MPNEWKTGSQSRATKTATRSQTLGELGLFRYLLSALMALNFFTLFLGAYLASLRPGAAISRSCFTPASKPNGERPRFTDWFAKLSMVLPQKESPTSFMGMATPPTMLFQTSGGEVTAKTLKKPWRMGSFLLAKTMPALDSPMMMSPLSANCENRGLHIRIWRNAMAFIGATFKSSSLALGAPLFFLSGCATSGGFHLPADDLKAVTESKPVPSDEIATSQKAADQFSESIEAWGNRISAAGGRLCRYTERTTGNLPFQCPKP